MKSSTSLFLLCPILLCQRRRSLSTTTELLNSIFTFHPQDLRRRPIDTMRRTILVTGATGKQGRALIHALLQPSAPSPAATCQYHIYALTRNASSPTAQSLLSAYGASNLTLVEGNLDERSTVVSVFEAARTDDANGNGVWGVFAVLAFPGLGASAEGEGEAGEDAS